MINLELLSNQKRGLALMRSIKIIKRDEERMKSIYFLSHCQYLENFALGVRKASFLSFASLVHLFNSTKATNNQTRQKKKAICSTL